MSKYELNWGPFSFKLFPTLVTLLAITLLVKLGFWQLERAEQKQQLFDDFGGSEQIRLQPLPTIQSDQLPPRYTEVQVQGEFDPERYFLRDNQIFNGVVGYHVIGLLTHPELADKVPVNLGWVAAPVDRSVLPELTLPSGQQNFNGLIYYPDQAAFQLSEQSFSNISWPLRLQQFEFKRLEAATGIPLQPYMVLLSESSELGYPRQWEPQVMAPTKHQAYALQWFSLALACALVFLFASRTTNKSEE